MNNEEWKTNSAGCAMKIQRQQWQINNDNLNIKMNNLSNEKLKGCFTIKNIWSV